MDINSLTREQLIERRDLLMRKAELEKKLNVKSVETQPNADLGFGNVETKMLQELPNRPNPFTAGADAVKSISMRDFIPGNIDGMGKQGVALMQVLGAPYMAAESVVANRAIGAQKDLRSLLNPIQGIKDVASGLTGPQRTIGDVNYRAGLNRPIADATALAQNIAVQGPELVEGAYKLSTKALKEAPKLMEGLAKKLLIGDKPKVDVLNSIRNSFRQIPVQARNSFGDDLIKLNNEKLMLGQNPSISVKPMIDSLQADMAVDELKPAVERVINSVPNLQKMIKNPALSENLTLKESQDLLNDIKSNLSNAKLSGVGNRPTDIPIYDDLINEITDAQLSIHPEFAQTKKTFGDIMNKYKLVKGKIGIGLEKNIHGKFGGAEANLAVKELLSSNPKALSKIDKFRRVKTIKDSAGKAVVGGLAAEEILVGGIRKKLGF